MVIDVHCDSEAVVHLYTLPASVAAFAPLAALAGAQAVLTAEESGDEPFDEACSTPWHRLAARFPGVPLPVSCDACTLELRGERDVSDDLAAADAAAILDSLVLRGAVAGPAPQVPAAVCAPTPLAGSEPIVAPVAGIVVFRRAARRRRVAGRRHCRARRSGRWNPHPARQPHGRGALRPRVGALRPSRPAPRQDRRRRAAAHRQAAEPLT